MKGRIYRWLATDPSLAAVVTFIAVMIAALAGIMVLDWYLAHWVSLPVWVVLGTVAALARPAWKAVRSR